MESILNIIKKRQSVRSYLNKKIPKKELAKILEAARLSPSAKNLQSWKFIVVDNKELIKKFVEPCKGQKFVGEADVIIVGCSDNIDYKMTCGQYAYTVDLAIAIENMNLMATELGIGCCWIGAFYEEKVKELLDIPNNVRIVSLLTLGYPKEELSGVKNRKKIEEIISYNKWNF